MPRRGAGGRGDGAAQSYFGDSWTIGLGFWIVPALFAALFWLPQTARSTARIRSPMGEGFAAGSAGLASHLVHWLQSSLATSVWLGALDPDQPWPECHEAVGAVRFDHRATAQRVYRTRLATRGKDQRLAIVVVMLLTSAGVCCLFAPIEGLWAGRFCWDWARAVRSAWR